MSRKRSSRGTSGDQAHTSPVAQMPADEAYRLSMVIIRSRFLALEAARDREARLVHAEQLALQVRKIVEGVAFSALSAVEIRNAQTLREQRTKDADKLLTWLDQRGLLRLPHAQHIEPPPSADIKFTLRGAGEKDMDLDSLKTAYSRASALVHERHPERLNQQAVEQEINFLEDDARRLRSWLWLHIMFLKDSAVLLQMGQYGNDSFFSKLDREAQFSAE